MKYHLYAKTYCDQPSHQFQRHATINISDPRVIQKYYSDVMDLVFVENVSILNRRKLPACNIPVVLILVKFKLFTFAPQNQNIRAIKHPFYYQNYWFRNSLDKLGLQSIFKSKFCFRFSKWPSTAAANCSSQCTEPNKLKIQRLPRDASYQSVSEREYILSVHSQPNTGAISLSRSLFDIRIQITISL